MIPDQRRRLYFVDRKKFGINDFSQDTQARLHQALVIDLEHLYQRLRHIWSIQFATHFCSASPGLLSNLFRSVSLATSQVDMDIQCKRAFAMKPFETSGVTVMTSARKYLPRDKFGVLYYEREGNRKQRSRPRLTKE